MHIGDHRWSPAHWFLNSTLRLRRGKVSYMATITICDCGHPAQPHGCAVGYSVGNDGKTSCYDCSNAAEIRAMQSADHFCGYLNSDCTKVTTWPGGELARVTWKVERSCGGFAWRTKRLYFNAVDAQGGQWYGNGLGGGMFCRLHRAKVSRLAKGGTGGFVTVTC